MRRLLIALGRAAPTFAIVAAVLAVTLAPRLWPAGGWLLGKPAPDFSLPVVANGDAGARLQLSELRGRVVVLEFWASWCKVCPTQSRRLEELARKNRKDVVVLGVSVDEQPERAARHAAGIGLSFLILSDSEGTAQASYRAHSLPTVVIVDPAGVVRYYAQGLVDESDIEDAIQERRVPP